MGMDLKPINPSPDAPQDEYGIVWGRYNWSGWSELINYLDKWEIDTSQLCHYNDGKIISEDKCIEIADAIENNLNKIKPDERDWYKADIVLWRTCGGYEQW